MIWTWNLIPLNIESDHNASIYWFLTEDNLDPGATDSAADPLQKPTTLDFIVHTPNEKKTNSFILYIYLNLFLRIYFCR